MKKTFQLEVIGCNPAKVGRNYILSLNAIETFGIGDKISVSYETAGLSLDGIFSGIQRVMGVTKEELIHGGSNAHNTYARKVYSRLRREMGISVGDIAHELEKATASVAYYLTDNSIKVKEYCDAVRNG